MFLSGAFVAAGGRGSSFDPVEELFGGIFFGGAGLFCAAVAYLQLRKRCPVRLHKRIRGLRLTVDRDEARRSEALSATIDLAEAAEDLEVGLVCIERYDLRASAQTKAGLVVVRETNEDVAYEEWQAVEPAAASGPLTLTLALHERTRDFDVVAYSSSLAVHEGDFDFTLPAEAPPGVKGKHSELYWQLDVESGAARRLEVAVPAG